MSVRMVAVMIGTRLGRGFAIPMIFHSELDDFSDTPPCPC
jgi:hypothetical protein